MIKTTKQWIGIATAASAAVLAAGCGSGSSGSDNVTVNGDVAIAYAKRANTITMNPTDGTPSAPGGDLIIREKSSPSASEINVTAGITQGNGDVSDPEVSYDGKKIVFAMKCPTSNTSTIGGAPACTGAWNIWEYDMTTGGMAGGSLRRITASGDDDVDPAYLPAGRGFVFSSNRQTQTRSVIGGQVFFAVDEYERERTLNLHTMTNDGSAITQISVNQSHDRNPVVRSNGDIMFSRWEHVGPRNRFAIFSSKPDGTNMFVLYGAHSPGNSFLHPREMDPAGAHRGKVASTLMSLSGTREGGALKLIDIENFSENNTPANRAVAASAMGQRDLTSLPIPDDRGLSLVGRATSPYPLWDGTDRILVAFHTCEVTKNNVVVPCAQLTQEEIDRLNSDRTDAEVAADTVQDNVPPIYSIYMYNPRNQTWLIVASPPPGFMYVDPVAIQSRPEPASPTPTTIDPALAAQGMALIEVRSVYDTDGLNRMAEPVLAAVDRPSGCSVGIAQTAATDPTDTRNSIADLVRIKDPADAAYHCAPARFVRAARAVAPMAGMSGMREAIGETDFEPQQILGYAPVEPDGSFKLLVPADTPIALSILDAKGRALQTHLNWIQVRPGERRTCDGCHSPRRGASINSGAVANALPAGLLASKTGQHVPGETLASLRTRLTPAALNLGADMEFNDVWADTGRSGVTARASIAVRYTGNADPANDLPAGVPAPVNGFINYPDQIQPIWTRDRGANTCTNCHTDPVKLDLRATISGTGRLTSYQELLLGDPLLDANGQPITRIEDGVPVIERGPALVETMAGDAMGLTRSSRLGEILFGEQLKASAEARTAHPNPPAGAPNHATMLNAAEKRLVTEWMDLGGQYFNNINASNSPAKRAAALSRTVFDSTIHPILTSQCIACHQPAGSSGAAQTGSTGSFANNRFILTGSGEGDFNVTLSMVSDTCSLASNALLQRPSTAPHPSGATGQPVPLPTGSSGYQSIANWISAGCRP